MCDHAGRVERGLAGTVAVDRGFPNAPAEGIPDAGTANVTAAAFGVIERIAPVEVSATLSVAGAWLWVSILIV